MVGFSNAPKAGEVCRMPTYEYRCDKCGEEFSVILTIGEHEAGKLSCPKCKSRKLSQLLTGFHAITAKKS
jgi:putative FmdB family regulatory protein